MWPWLEWLSKVAGLILSKVAGLRALSQVVPQSLVEDMQEVTYQCLSLSSSPYSLSPPLLLFLKINYKKKKKKKECSGLVMR